MADCTSCTKNQAALTTVLSLMEQQSAMLKDQVATNKEQQSTIARLTSMISNGATPSNISFPTSGDNRQLKAKINPVPLPSSTGTGHSIRDSTKKRRIAETSDDETVG